MFLMTIPDGEGLVATQRFYNLLKSIYVYGTNKPESGTVLRIGDFVMELAHTAITEQVDGLDDVVTRVNITFVLGDDEFLIDKGVHCNDEWDKWVLGQPVRCQEVPREEFVGEFMEFLLDYYPDYEI
jgi:hypothetical protein